MWHNPNTNPPEPFKTILVNYKYPDSEVINGIGIVNKTMGGETYWYVKRLNTMDREEYSSYIEIIEWREL